MKPAWKPASPTLKCEIEKVRSSRFALCQPHLFESGRIAPTSDGLTTVPFDLHTINILRCTAVMIGVIMAYHSTVVFGLPF
jgi:hypothetical protein